MDLKEKTQAIVRVMQTAKEDWVASEPEQTDIAIYLHFWRGDDMIAAVQCPLDRDAALWAGRIGATGFAAQTMMITFESFHSTLGSSPITHERWKPQEMQYVFETVPENKTEHWVDECLSTMAHERGGEFAMVSQGYVIEDGKLVWRESQEFYADSDGVQGHPAGFMFDYLQESMTTQTIAEHMAEQAEQNEVSAIVNNLVTDPERRLFHTDMATFRHMVEQKVATAVVFSAPRGSLREQLLEERTDLPGMDWKQI